MNDEQRSILRGRPLADLPAAERLEYANATDGAGVPVDAPPAHAAFNINAEKIAALSPSMRMMLADAFETIKRLKGRTSNPSQVAAVEEAEFYVRPYVI